MCVDMLEAQRALEKYCQMLPAFEDSREYTLLKVSLICVIISNSFHSTENSYIYLVSNYSYFFKSLS